MSVDITIAEGTSLQLMKDTVLAESSILYFSFSLGSSAAVMSTDVSQVGVPLFPSF